MAKNRIPPLSYAFNLACLLDVSLDFLVTGVKQKKSGKTFNVDL
jgi:hypothetical protein